MTNFHLTIIIPVLNEAGNVSEMCRRIEKAMKSARIVYQIVFVVDKSTDGTEAAVQHLALSYPVIVHKKTGKPGKAFSILEGLQYVQSEHVVMIDGDLQYPPEAIAEMFALKDKFGLIVANRKTRETGIVRILGSKLNSFIFGKLLLGLHTDTQSGLKLFRKDIIDHLDMKNVGKWSLDAPLLYTALDLGHKIGSVDIEFSERSSGQSKVNFLSVAAGIAWGSLKLRLSPKNVYHLPATTGKSMLGAGMAFKKHRFITHTTLHSSKSAITTISDWQKFALIGVLILIGLGLFLNALLTITVLIGILSAIYFIDVFFTLFLVLKSLHFPPEINFAPNELKDLDQSSLPIYSILCPLYKEASVLSQFVKNIEKLDYPKKKLDVILLLEEGDDETIAAAAEMSKPDYLRVIIVPNSQPKTKPKACNYGLSIALGKYVVVYDAEDQPEPDQLKKAVLGFANLPDSVYCLQAKLNYYNPHHNLLTRLFTAEYSLWFDLVLPAFQSINTAIPLGGTSNHFRKTDLLKLGGWDAFNVTEDCDLGMRLFKEGYKTAIIDSITLEEANSDVANWIRQRSRWIKGYIQTYLVHTRNPIETVKQLGWHSLIFQLVIGARTTFMLINPILWVLTISYFVLYRFVGPTIESLYPAPVFYVAVFSLAAGNFIYLYNYMIACAKRGQWSLIKFVFIVPVYWLMVSIAALKGFFQLLWKPHFWEKTNHGLHLKKTVVTKDIDVKEVVFSQSQAISNKKVWLPKFITSHPLAVSGGILVVATLLTNFLFLLSSTFLTRSNLITFEQIGVLGLIGSVLTIFDVFAGSFGRTISYQSAYLFGKFGDIVKSVWQRGLITGAIIGSICVTLWVALSPLIGQTLHTSSWPLYIFAPVLLLAFINTVNNSFLLGSQKFVVLSAILVLEALTKLALTVVFVQISRVDLIYTALPLSILISTVIGTSAILLIKEKKSQPLEKIKFPYKFLISSFGFKISLVLFFGADIVLAKFLLSPDSAGHYVLLTSIGKMVYIFGGLFTQFITPLVAKKEGERKQSTHDFKTILTLTILCSSAVAFVIGPLGSIVIPFIFGSKALSIVSFLIPYSVAMAAFAVAGAVINYHQVKKHYFFSVVGLLFSFIQIAAIYALGNSVSGIVTAVTFTAGAYLATTIALHATYGLVISTKNNLFDFAHLFIPQKQVGQTPLKESKESILIFNWRDTKHVWGGGAEVYVQELAKRWVSDGHPVTIFCGHDGKSPRYETLDGVNIIRRGGFYFVYVWAAIYYLRFMRNKFDIIVDCENGIPFFTPLFSKKKKFLLIYHVHRVLFRQKYLLPIAMFAEFLEQKIMPFIYRNVQVITISESSKKEILEHKLTKTDPIVIHCGVDLNFYKPGKKSTSPLILSLSRLDKIKSLQVFIRSAAKVLESIPHAQFVIAGDGPDKQSLMDLVDRLGLTEKIRFLGKVSELEKRELYQKAWVFVNPSMMEGWGITSIEANACGTPVVASNVPGLRDSVNNPHTGFLVPYGDHDRFADRIIALIQNKNFRIQTGKYGVIWSKNFDWDHSAKNFLNLIKL